MNLEQTLEKIVELAPRGTLTSCARDPRRRRLPRDHGHDFHEAQTAADRLDHYAHQVRRLHDAEYRKGWRHESAADG